MLHIQNKNVKNSTKRNDHTSTQWMWTLLSMCRSQVLSVWLACKHLHIRPHSQATNHSVKVLSLPSVYRVFNQKSGIVIQDWQQHNEYQYCYCYLTATREWSKSIRFYLHLFAKFWKRTNWSKFLNAAKKTSSFMFKQCCSYIYKQHWTDSIYMYRPIESFQFSSVHMNI